MTLFTGKGDDGTTKTFGDNQRISKHSSVINALGALDELNSFLGLCKVRSSSVSDLPDTKHERTYAAILHDIQQDLFIIQAELAGADKAIEEAKVEQLSSLINRIEKQMPPIQTFFVPGGTELAALLDVARTQARRTERLLVAVADEGAAPLQEATKAYINRLSSVLYALARLANHQAGHDEEPPTYA